MERSGFLTARDAAALAERAAELCVATIAAAVAARGRAVLALSGGSTPKALYQLLAGERFRRLIPWERLHVFWSDERCVPPDHEDSNYRMAHAALLAHVPIPAANVHRIQAERPDPADAARRYEAETLGLFAGAPPRFDLVLLGMGDDGHTASLFPATAALAETRRLVVANRVDKLGAWRVTFTARLINQAHLVVFLIADAKKRAVLHEVVRGARDPARLPAQLVAPADGRLVWLVLAGMEPAD